MKSNDLSKRLATRFKKSKDFLKTIEKLQKEKYTTRLTGKVEKKKTYSIIDNEVIEETTNEYEIVYHLRVYKDNREMVYVVFTSRPREEEYKNYIWKIEY